jgi:small subunit ribosomal protein S2e
LKDEVMKIKPVQKQTRAGQRTRFKAVVAVGDSDGHIGLGIKTAAEVANAIKGAGIYAKLAILPVRRGYWGNKIGQPHTVPNTVTGKCGSIRMRLIPAPRGSGIVAGSVAKKLLSMAGFEDVFTSSIGHTKTTTNFLVATYKAIEATFSFLTPDQWEVTEPETHPFVGHSQYLAGLNEYKVTKVPVNLNAE